MKTIRYHLQKKAFNNLFDQVVTNLTRVTALFMSFALSKNIPMMGIYREEMFELEQEGDMLTHDIVNKLFTSSVPYEERRDMYLLACRLDDIVDFIWNAVDKMYVFKVEPTQEVTRIAKNFINISQVLAEAVRKLLERKYDDVIEYSSEMKKQGKMMRRIFRQTIGKIFEEADTILVVKWKDVYRHLEDASKRHKDIAKILEEIVLKNS